MEQCATCGSQLQRKDFDHCGNLQFCPQCETKKYVRSKIYLNGKEMEYCVEVNTRTGMARILSATEEDDRGRK